MCLEKMQYAFAAQYPMSWGVKIALANNYKKLGVYMSAHELLKSIGDDEESIRCLFMAGRQSLAIELAEEYMKTGAGVRNYNLICLMGEMKGDHTWFERAWEESGHRCAKAMRMLGRHYFYKQEWTKCIECYDKALAINKLYPDIWFAKGCAHMRLEDYKNAIFALGTVISLDAKKVEAWANIASCYITTGKHFEAVTCCEQALKCNRKSWRIWNNYIIFSIETLQFYKAANGIRTLLVHD